MKKNTLVYRIIAILTCFIGMLRITVSVIKVDKLGIYLKLFVSSLIQFFICFIATITAINIMVHFPNIDSFTLFCVIIVTVFILLLTNVIIEFIMLITHNEDEKEYEYLLDRQKRLHNQGLAIISVHALYLSASLDDINIILGNFSLFLLGILLVLSTILIDVYELFIHKKGYVKKLVIEVKKIWYNDYAI